MGREENTLSALTATLITYTVARAANKRDEMKHLRGALETAIHELGNRDKTTVDRLLDTVEKMADALAPAVKSAVAPVGASARTLTAGVIAGQSRSATVEESRCFVTYIIPFLSSFNKLANSLVG